METVMRNLLMNRTQDNGDFKSSLHTTNIGSSDIRKAGYLWIRPQGNRSLGRETKSAWICYSDSFQTLQSLKVTTRQSSITSLLRTACFIAEKIPGALASTLLCRTTAYLTPHTTSSSGKSRAS